MKYTADFETTTDERDCRVWAYGVQDIDSDTFIYGNSLEEFMGWCFMNAGSTIYFHNLKFDGEFILSYLLKNGYTYTDGKLTDKTFSTLISGNQFYSIEICHKKKKGKASIIKIYDSLKIIPFTVDVIAKSFGLPISKLKIDYEEYRSPFHIISKDELEYLKNDVKIVASALKVLFEQGLTKITQGSNALFDFKQTIGIKNFERWFPVPENDEFIRKSYKGGFTYLNPKYAGEYVNGGMVFDVNSLYPWAMYYMPLPYGEGKYYVGEYQKDDLYNLYVQKIVCNFELKKDKLPTIQLKNRPGFIDTEYLTDSKGEDVVLYLTNVDLELFLEHYDVYNIIYCDGWKYKSTVGIFKEYIDKWNKVKIESTLNGNKGMRTLAKLMLNALYGKFASQPQGRSKIPYLDDGIVKYKTGNVEARTPVYIPVGTFITSWARQKTIRSAQQLYPYFIYADTDSLHLSLSIFNEVIDIPEKTFNGFTTDDFVRLGYEELSVLDINAVDMGKWKAESLFKRGKYLRAKTYIEDIENRLKITCAGLPERSYKNVTWENFNYGKTYGNKLKPVHVDGGIVLRETEFTLKRC